MDFRLFKLRTLYDLNTPQGKLDYLNDAVKLICELDNPMERDIYASRLSDETDVAKPTIMEQISRGIRRNNYKRRKTEFSQIQKNISARDDRVNPQHADNLRAASAEENLLAYLINNPDKLTYIHERLSPDDFLTDFNRKLYIYFSDKILNNTDPLISVSADFSEDERSKIFRLANSYPDMPHTVQALDEFIGIIKEEKSKPTDSEIRNSTQDEFASLFSKLKDTRQ
jgi:DNA primase